MAAANDDVGVGAALGNSRRRRRKVGVRRSALTRIGIPAKREMLGRNRLASPDR